MKTIEKENMQKILKELEKLKEENKILKSGRRFGLIWEDHPETLDDNSFPMLEEAKEKEIDKGGQKHLFIEGDNLYSLRSLLFTHRDKVDLIYIDPPYNTGNNDFKYNDKFIDKEDVYKHSKWISFMEKRLKLAKELLKEDGIIIISIDDNEMPQLKLLCDLVFGESNGLGVLPTIMNLKGNQDQFGFAGTHEYTLVYAKNKEICSIGQFPIDEEEVLEEWEEDEYGYYKKGANLKATGVNAPREKRPNLFFPIYVNPDGTFSVDNKKENSVEVYPITKDREMSWRWSKNKFRKENHNVIVNFNNGNPTFYKKQRPAIGDLPTKKPKSVFYKPQYSSGNGTKELEDVLGNSNRIFNNPKPLQLIKDLITIGTTKKDAVILDFFAGSGTTAQAVLELNKEDGGKRQFILCTNNENGIAEEVTYKRIYNVIHGYIKPDEEIVDGIDGTLHYFKTKTIGDVKEPTKQSIKNVIDNLEDLIKIKHESHKQISREIGYSLYQNGESAVGYLKDIYSAEKFNSKLKTLKNKEKHIYIISHDEKTVDYISEKLKKENSKIIIHKIPEEIQKFFSTFIRKKGDN